LYEELINRGQQPRAAVGDDDDGGAAASAGASAAPGSPTSSTDSEAVAPSAQPAGTDDDEEEAGLDGGAAPAPVPFVSDSVYDDDDDGVFVSEHAVALLAHHTPVLTANALVSGSSSLPTPTPKRASGPKRIIKRTWGAVKKLLRLPAKGRRTSGS